MQTLPKPKYYIIGNPVGSGKFGSVYKVYSRKHSNDSLGRKSALALKIMEKAVIHNSNAFNQIQREREILARISYPFIVSFVEAFQTSKQLYLVMSFCEGKDLRALLNTQKVMLGPEQCLFYIGEIALGLQYLHKSGILYRDMKPGNVLVEVTGHIRICDFGLSISKIERPLLGWATGAKTKCGTLHYAAPEILSNASYGYACDWWSLGVIFYVMLTGTMPYEGGSSRELLSSINSSRLRVPQTWPADIRSCVESLLCKDPRRRLLSGEKLSEPSEGIAHMGRDTDTEANAVTATDSSRNIFDLDAFERIDKGKLERKELIPPILPLPEPCTNSTSTSISASDGGKASSSININEAAQSQGQIQVQPCPVSVAVPYARRHQTGEAHTKHPPRPQQQQHHKNNNSSKIKTTNKSKAIVFERGTIINCESHDTLNNNFALLGGAGAAALGAGSYDSDGDSICTVESPALVLAEEGEEEEEEEGGQGGHGVSTIANKDRDKGGGRERGRVAAFFSSLFNRQDQEDSGVGVKGSGCATSAPAVAVDPVLTWTDEILTA